MVERGVSFRGVDREPSKAAFAITPDEWHVFMAACERVGVEPTGATYWQWRLHEGPFGAGS